MDTLHLVERIQKTIELGESQFREFKSALEGTPSNKKPRDPKSIAKDIAETLVSFANADGGELLVGVEDEGIITGITYKDDTISKLLEVPKTGMHPDTPLESPIARRVKLEDNEILYFSIEKSTRTVHQTSDGRCLQRKDRENRPVSAIQLQFERQEQNSREYDRQFIDGAQVTDLNLDLVRRVSDQITSMSPEKCLQYLGLAEYGMGVMRLRRAGLLLFAKDVSRWHPRCQVRIVRIRGTELKTGRDYNVISDEIATGNILEIITSAWEKLRPHLVETKMTPDALFKERVMYPEDVCREALTNAITHRDYSLEGQNIEILIFDDRMEVHSPGGLLSTIKIQELIKLQGIHESRNAYIARVLREIGYVREMGEGIRRIFRLMQDADLIPPELYSTPSRFSIILHHKSVFSDIDQRWLDGFKPFKFNKEEMLIALLGREGNLLSPQQIYDRLNLVDWDIYREIIDQIQTKGVLYNRLTQNEKVKLARARKVSQRAIQRLAVRQPEELERALSDVFKLLQNMGPISLVDKNYIEQVTESLPPQHVYKFSYLRFTRFLKLFGLIDDEKRPSSTLQALWGESVRDTMPVRDIYVGNLEYRTTRDELEKLFAPFGNVDKITMPLDYVTQANRGFAFIKMSNQIEAEKALQMLNGTLFRERVLRLNW